jgi:hypothetical protein
LFNIENSFDVVIVLSLSDKISKLFLIPFFKTFEATANSIAPLFGFGKIVSVLFITSQFQGI